MNLFFGTPAPLYPSRRDFLRRTGSGAGLLALASLLRDTGLLVAAPHFPAKAKSVIWLFMNGGQSQVDTYDYKPALEKYDGKPLPKLDSKTGFFVNQVGGLMKSPFKFQAARPVGHLGVGTVPAPGRASWTIWPSSTPATPSRTITGRPCFRSTPACRGWAFRASARG